MEYNPKKDISLSEAARRRGITPQAMSFLANKEIFKVKRIGRQVFVNIDDIKNYIPDKGGRPKKT